MQNLFNSLNRPFQEFGENPVSFIRFNYDISVEYYLFNCLKNSYRQTDDEGAKQLRKIPIVHVHGNLGALPWQGFLDGREHGGTLGRTIKKGECKTIKKRDHAQLSR